MTMKIQTPKPNNSRSASFLRPFRRHYKTFALLLLSFPLTLYLYHKSPDRKIYDIDVGSLGQDIERTGDVLITFDPFDKQLITPGYERHPYLVTDYDGMVNFTENRDSPSCSTIHRRNLEYNMTKRFELMNRGCGKGQALHPGYELCLAPKHTHRKLLRCIRLSSFIKKKGVRKIGFLKIDTQGSDFSIIKDLFENVEDISVKRIKFECQFYDDAIPMFYVQNSCEDAISYLQQKRKFKKLQKQLQGCQTEEYNIIIDFET